MQNADEVSSQKFIYLGEGRVYVNKQSLGIENEFQDSGDTCTISRLEALKILNDFGGGKSWCTECSLSQSAVLQKYFVLGDLWVNGGFFQNNASDGRPCIVHFSENTLKWTDTTHESGKD